MISVKTIIAVLLGSAGVVALMAFWYQSAYAPPPTLNAESVDEYSGPFTPEEQIVKSEVINNDMNPQAIIKTSAGEITLELYANLMPVTVANFVELANSNFYNETKIHRVIEGFMIQGGDPNTKGDNEAIYGTGGPAENIPDEFVSNELLTNVRGTIAMANTGQPNSGGSQWFINLVDNTGLDFDKPPLTSKHPVFGRVVSGMEVVDTIGRAATKERDIPVEPIVIEAVTIVEAG